LRDPRLIAAVIVVSVLVVFGRLCSCEFTWYDDSATIHQNPSFNPPTSSKVMSYWSKWGKDAPMGLYIPLTYTVWGALSAVAYSPQADPSGIHLNPWIFHTANVVLHALSSLLVFALLRRLVAHPWAAGLGALLFALHPLQVEPVGWISGTKDLLCGMLSLVALWQYLSLARTAAGQRTRRLFRAVLRYSIATVALLGAMLSKPTAVVVPLIAMLIEVFILHVSFKASLRRLLPWLVLVIPCLLWTKGAQTTTDVPVAPVWARPLIALDSLAFYLYKLIWPVKLTVVYERTPIQVLENGWCYYTWVVPVLVAAGLILNHRRTPKLLCAAAILLAGVLPVLGFVPFQFQRHSGVADHYLYLSMLGVGLFGAVLLDRFSNRITFGTSAAVLVVLAALSFRQCGTWQNELRLWEQNLAVNPNSIMAHRKLAQICVTSGLQAEAIHHFQQVLRISDQLPPARRSPLDTSHFLLGQIFMSRGEHAQAIEQFQAALAENPQLEAARDALVAAQNQLRAGATTR
jgi:hypothetical protein